MSHDNHHTTTAPAFFGVNFTDNSAEIIDLDADTIVFQRVTDLEDLGAIGIVLRVRGTAIRTDFYVRGFDGVLVQPSEDALPQEKSEMYTDVEGDCGWRIIAHAIGAVNKLTQPSNVIEKMEEAA